jgi:hypothetical protein
VRGTPERLALEAPMAPRVIIPIALGTFSDGLNTVNVVIKNGGDRKIAFRWLLVDALAPILGALTSLAFRFSDRMMNSSTQKRVYGLRALPPALALADLYTDPNAWHPDPDDLDVPDQDHDAVLSAFELLGVDRRWRGVF